MKFTVTLAHFVRDSPVLNGTDWYPTPVPGTITKPGVWDTETDAGKLVWDGYCQMRGSKELSVSTFRDALNEFLMFLQGLGRDNYQRVYRITEAEPATLATV